MTDADRGAFARLITDVLGFYGQTVSDFAISVWWEACQPFSLEQVRKAMSAHATDPDVGRFAPKPADVVRVLRGSHGDRSLVAWSKVHQAMSAVGAYESVVFDDPAIHTAVEDIGGWTAICRSEVDELPHLQRRFCQSYQSAVRGDRPHPPKLVGDYERLSMRSPHAPPKPVLIGDPEKCRQVLVGGSDGSGLQVQRLSDVVPVIKRIGKAA